MKKLLFFMLLLAAGCARKTTFQLQPYIPQSIQQSTPPTSQKSSQDLKKAKAFTTDSLYLLVLKHNLKIKTMENTEKQETTRTPKPSFSPQGSAAPAATPENPNILKLKFQLVGPVQSLLGFLTDVEAAKRFITVQKLSLSHDPDSALSDQILLETQLNIDSSLADDPSILKMFIPKPVAKTNETVNNPSMQPNEKQSDEKKKFFHAKANQVMSRNPEDNLPPRKAQPLQGIRPSPSKEKTKPKEKGEEEPKPVRLVFEVIPRIGETGTGFESTSSTEEGIPKLRSRLSLNRNQNPTPGPFDRGLSDRGNVQSHQTEKLQIEFLGTFSEGSSIQALVSFKDEYKLVARGDSFQGYRITNIGPDRLVLSGPGGTQTLTLDENEKKSTQPYSPTYDQRNPYPQRSTFPPAPGSSEEILPPGQIHERSLPEPPRDY